MAHSTAEASAFIWVNTFLLNVVLGAPSSMCTTSDLVGIVVVAEAVTLTDFVCEHGFRAHLNLPDRPCLSSSAVQVDVSRCERS